MTDAKLVRFAAVVIVLATYVFVFRGGEARIAERLDENARIAERVRAGERTLASRPRVEADRSRLRRELRAVELDADRSALVARFLRDAARIAAVHHAVIPTITATGTSSGVTAAPNAPREPLEAIPLEITVEGRYADVLATMRALSRLRVLAAVDIASLARKHADGGDATLTAALHVALERRAPAELAPPTGPADVRAGRG
jgi:Tfp pilus assembly protein PilO